MLIHGHTKMISVGNKIVYMTNLKKIFSFLYLCLERGYEERWYSYATKSHMVFMHLMGLGVRGVCENLSIMDERA